MDFEAKEENSDELYFCKNQLTKIGSNLFQHLSKLKILNLGRIQINEIKWISRFRI